MSEFKYCALKKHLPRALNLEFDPNTSIHKEVNLNENEEKKEDNAVIIVKSNEEKLTLKENEPQLVKQDDIKENKLEIPVIQENKDKDKLSENQMETAKAMIKKEQDDDVFPIGKQYIDFKKFCDHMRLFNPRTPIDTKVKCINLSYYSLFLPL